MKPKQTKRRKASPKSIRENYFDNIKDKGDRVIFYQCSKCHEGFQDTDKHKCEVIPRRRGRK